MEININEQHEIITEHRLRFSGIANNNPREYEFYHPKNYSQMSTLIEIKNCISEVQVGTADSYGDLIFQNDTFKQNFELPYENKQILLVPLYRNPLYLSIWQFQMMENINWPLLNKEFNTQFDQTKAVFSIKRSYIPQQLQSPYDSINYPEKPLIYKLNSNKIQFQVNPLSCENHCLSTGFTVKSFIYALHIWDDPNVLKYRLNCNPSLNSPYKGFSYYLAYNPADHSALNYLQDFIEFPEFKFSDIKQSVFLDSKSKKKLIYASVQAFVNIDFNERLFDGSDKEFKENFRNYDLTFEYPISEVILEQKQFWLNKTFLILFVIGLIIIGVSFIIISIVQKKTQKRLTELNLDMSDVKNLEIGLKPLESSQPEQRQQKIISFGKNK